MVALCDKLTAESVAWVCIAVSSSLTVKLMLDLMDVTLSQRYREQATLLQADELEAAIGLMCGTTCEESQDLAGPVEARG
jgi:hypothetical protein